MAELNRNSLRQAVTPRATQPSTSQYLDHTLLLVAHKQTGTFRWMTGAGSCIWGALFFCFLCVCVCLYFWAHAPITSDSFGNKALESVLTSLKQCLSPSAVSVCVFVFMKLRMSVWIAASVAFRGEVYLAVLTVCDVFIYLLSELLFRLFVKKRCTGILIFWVHIHWIFQYYTAIHKY